MRPYLTASTDELIALAQEHWDNARELERLQAETAFRKAKSAAALGRDLQKRRAILASMAAKEKTGTQREVPDAAVKLRAAEVRIRGLEQQLVMARAMRQSPLDERLAKWGLCSACPPSLFETVKRTWRKNLHPDSHADRSPEDRKSLERMFQEFEVDLVWLAKQGWPPTS
jgi:hypothetical protein